MTVTSLEMTSPADLRPGAPPPSPVVLDHLTDAAVVRDLYNRIWAPLGPSGRSAWTEAQWTAELSQPGIHTYQATIHNTPAGFAAAVTQTAWTLNTPTTRVWLQTSSGDHPHALCNYVQRGFRIFDRQDRV